MAIAAVIGLTATVATGTGVIGFDFNDVATHTGNGLSYAYKYVKAAGIVSAFLGFMFILFRFNIVGWKMAPENASFMIARRGRIVRKRESGEIVLHDSGRNRLHLINYRHLVIIHFGDRFIELGSTDFTLDDVTWKCDFTLRWRIPKDKKLLERIVTSVSDQNWWDGEFNQLTRAIKEMATGQLAPLLKQARIDEQSNTPEFDRELAEELFGQAIAPYGGKFYELIASPATRTEAQQGKDGSQAIADAISSVKFPATARTLFGLSGR